MARTLVFPKLELFPLDTNYPAPLLALGNTPSPHFYELTAPASEKPRVKLTQCTWHCGSVNSVVVSSLTDTTSL